MTLSLPSPLSCLSTRTILFSSNKCFTCFSTFLLYGNSFLQSQKPGSLSLTTSLVARIWCFQPSPASGWKPKPRSKLLQAKPPKIISSILAWKILWTEKPGGIQCREPARGIPLVTKVMRKETRHMQRWDRPSGVPPDILEHLPPKNQSVPTLLPFALTSDFTGPVPHHHLALSEKELTYSSS